ncbi:hypothetical protein GCM10009776_34810 [Microbacterium deminutum]|uniref:PNPLA domain-containing protein n=2 Tax=Microbacterium deminutum TaxID=344164 RepID=A0ABN2RGR5_9MICO
MVAVLSYVVFLFVIFMLSRKAIQISAYSAFLAHVFTDESLRGKDKAARTKEIRGTRLADISDEGVQHIFCATELVSGRPFYMSARRLTSPAFGTCEPEIDLARVIYASAAFPAIFPPLSLGTKRLGLRGGEEPVRPPKIVLADGGVYNNLGTDWFEDSTRPLSMIHDFGATTPVARKIIVNASAPRRVRRIQGWWPARNIHSLMRIFGVMYENTVAPRLDALKSSADEGQVAVIDIAFSTGAAARTLCSSLDEDIKERAKGLAKTLGESSLSGYLDKIAIGSSGTRTKLSRIGEAATVQLLIHGYVSALVSCHAILGTDVVLPERAWFEEMIVPSRRRPDARKSAVVVSEPSTDLPVHSQEEAEVAATAAVSSARRGEVAQNV